MENEVNEKQKVGYNTVIQGQKKLVVFPVKQIGNATVVVTESYFILLLDLLITPYNISH